MSLKHYVALYSLTHSMDYTYIDKDWPVLKNNIYSPCSHTLPQIWLYFNDQYVNFLLCRFCFKFNPLLNPTVKQK